MKNSTKLILGYVIATLYVIASFVLAAEFNNFAFIGQLAFVLVIVLAVSDCIDSNNTKSL